MKPLICPEDGKPCTCAEEPVGKLYRTGDPKVGCPREQAKIDWFKRYYPNKRQHPNRRRGEKWRVA